MRCLACDCVNSDLARFCTNCGYALVPTVQPQWAASAPPPLPPATAYPVGATPPGYRAAAYANPQPLYAHNPVPQVIYNLTVAAPAPVVVVQGQDRGPHIVARALWFLFLGLWLGAVCTSLAWLRIISIIGLPLGLMIINWLPQIMTLKPTPAHLQVTRQNGVVLVRYGSVPQRPFALRAVYFVLVGWWASLLWLSVAWVLIATTLGLALPLSFWMINRTPAVTTLAHMG